MNEPEINLPNTARSIDANEAHESLRRQINLLFGALIISSFTLTAYLGLQARSVSLDCTTAKTQLDGAIRAFDQENVSVQTALTKLQEFARTHPDFQKQIFAKYKINGPMPAAPAAPKK
jgi:hypothetical protein